VQAPQLNNIKLCPLHQQQERQQEPQPLQEQLLQSQQL
jgi:hypothetical protein